MSRADGNACRRCTILLNCLRLVSMCAGCRQALLWGLDDDMDAEATAVLLEERGVMRVACLADGTAWALVDPALLQRLQACCIHGQSQVSDLGLLPQIHA